MAIADEIASIPISCLSGSAGAIVASHNQYGPYVRDRTSPTGILTLRKILARQALTYSAAAWSAVTAAQRIAWEAYAVQLRRRQPAGRHRARTGRDEFMRCNCLRFRLPFATEPWDVEDPPATIAQPALHGLGAESDTSAGRLRVWFHEGDAWVTQPGSALLLYASPALTAAIRFHKAPMRLCPPLFGSSGSPPTSPTFIAWPYGTASPDRPVNVFFRVTMADGRLSRKYYDRAGVAT